MDKLGPVWRRAMFENQSSQQKKILCKHSSELKTYLSKNKDRLKKGERLIEENTQLCIHVDEMPKCRSSNKLIFKNAVIGSDGALYSEEEFKRILDLNDGFSIADAQELLCLDGTRKYLPIRIACKNLVFSKIDPRRVITPSASSVKPKPIILGEKRLMPSQALVFVGESSKKGIAVLFIEKLTDCVYEDVTYFHGKIDSYIFQQKPNGKGCEIVNNSFSDIDYTTLTQYDLLEKTFGVDSRQVECRTFGCNKEQIASLENRIQSDIRNCANGKLQYSEWAEKLMPSIWAWFVRGAVWHHSCSWARDVLRDNSVQILKKEKDISFDEDFPLFLPNDPNNPYRPICISSKKDALFSATQERIFPSEIKQTIPNSSHSLNP